MRPTSALVALSLGIGLVVSFASLDATVNLLVNPGFETTSTAWSKSTAGARSVDTTKSHSGTNSQKMLVSAQYVREVYQVVTVTAGVSYSAGGWMETSGAGGVGARIELQWFDRAVTTDVPPNGALIRTDIVGAVGGTQAWTQVAGQFSAPARAVQARFRLSLAVDPDGVGAGWFDDLEFIAVPDVTPPTIANVGASGIGLQGATITWTTDEPADTQVEFGTSAAYGSFSPLDPSAVTGHSVTLAGLAPNTIYHYRVLSKDSAGNATASGDFTFATLPDQTSPVVALAWPQAGATVVGAVLLRATATDNVGVAGVQFRLDGIALGSEFSTGPYDLAWDSTTATDGAHTLEAVGRDAAGNTASSGVIAFAVSNHPDQTPPAVGLTAPSAGATVSGTVTVSASATDDVAVAGVRFTLDGAPLGSELTVAPFDLAWDTASATPGPHTLQAVARDAAGNSTTSAPVSVTVSDQDAPTVTITAPAAQTTVGGTVMVTASATDNVGVAGVQFRLDGSPLGAEVTSAPYDLSWDTATVGDGTHTLEAVARDAAGNTRTSPPISLTVNNQPLVNALVNPGLESGSLAWTKSSSGGRPIDSVVRHSGANSQKILVSSVFTREVYQVLAAAGGGTYVLRGWISTSGVGGAGAQIQVQWLNQPVTTDVPPSGAVIRTDIAGTVAGTQSWTQVSGTVTAPANAVQLRFRLFVGTDPDGAGTAWYDDLELLVGADVTPPSVAMTFPVSGTTISNTIALSAGASDDRAVAGVSFHVDGAPIGAEDTTAPYSMTLDTTLLAPGAHGITAVARDAAGNQATSPAVTVNVVSGSSRPNIIVILTDDQRFDTMQFLPLTSALLNDSSVKFDNAFTTTPDCCPSRASLLTGRYSHNHGVLQDYGQSGGAPAFNPSSTFATWLKDSGYRTGIFGKYLNGYYLLSPAVPPGWSEFHAFVRNTITGGDSDYYHNYELNDNGVVTAYGAAVTDYSTDVLTAKALGFINGTAPDQPMLLYFTPYGPHDPATPHPSDAGAFAGLPAWRPPSFNEPDVSTKPLWVRSLPLFTQADIDEVDTFRRRQIETLQSVDRAVASLIAALQQTGRWNNTRLVFMSDNGLTWGEHRIKHSKFAAYEESVRVPLWVWAPGLAPRHDASIVANIDIAPTIADWAGVIPPTSVNGSSLTGLLADPSVPWRTELLLEYLGPTIITANRFYAVRTTQYTYIESFSGERELYDLAIDPFQLVNRVNDAAYASIVSTLQTTLNQLKVR